MNGPILIENFFFNMFFNVQWNVDYPNSLHEFGLMKFVIMKAEECVKGLHTWTQKKESLLLTNLVLDTSKRMFGYY